MSAAPNADALLAEAVTAAAKVAGCDASGRDDDYRARIRLAAEAGYLRGLVRSLCAGAVHLESAAGIAESIAALPSRHADLLAVAVALRDRIEAEDASGKAGGMDRVAEYLTDAVGAMGECYAVDMDAERASYAYAKAQDERAELRGGAYAAALRATR